MWSNKLVIIIIQPCPIINSLSKTPWMHSCEQLAWVSLLDMQHTADTHTHCSHLIAWVGPPPRPTLTPNCHAVPEKRIRTHSESTSMEPLSHVWRICQDDPVVLRGGLMREIKGTSADSPLHRLFLQTEVDVLLLSVRDRVQPASPIMSIVEVCFGATGGSWHTVHRQIKSLGSEGRNKGSEI